MEKETIIISYINIWNWHILAIILLMFSFVFILQGNLMGDVLWIASLFGFMLCEGISFKRRFDLSKKDE